MEDTMLTNIRDVLEYFEETMAANPERDGSVAEEAAWAGSARRYPALCLNHFGDPFDTTVAVPFFSLPERRFADDAEGRICEKIVRSLAPLDMLNPVYKVIRPEGVCSPADLIPCFGFPLSEDRGAPAYTRTMADMLNDSPPDPETSGLLPVIRESIDLIKSLTPASFKIDPPDMQGPFNLIHAMVGNDAFTAPLTDPDDYRLLMERITDFWIAMRENLTAWIGLDRLRPLDRVPRIAECSVNMVSEGFYREHILPYDRKIAEHFGHVRIHVCSGLHVFRATLDNLPVVATDAGTMLHQMAAPVVSGKTAFDMIGDRPVVLTIGEELPEDQDEASRIMADNLELYKKNRRLLFFFTGVFWRKKDRPMIRDLHRRLDEVFTALG
ncbi:MAG: uroporphyrinogen decarboxylase family protein [bacterium]|nr:uroporphyrinogen decarboxylase family protein [bacterium]